MNILFFGMMIVKRSELDMILKVKIISISVGNQDLVLMEGCA